MFPTHITDKLFSLLSVQQTAFQTRQVSEWVRFNVPPDI